MLFPKILTPVPLELTCKVALPFIVSPLVHSAICLATGVPEIFTDPVPGPELEAVILPLASDTSVPAAYVFNLRAPAERLIGFG